MKNLRTKHASITSFKTSTSLSSISSPTRKNYSAQQTPITSVKRPRRPGSNTPARMRAKDVCVNNTLNSMCENDNSGSDCNVKEMKQIEYLYRPAGFERKTINEMSPMHPPKRVPCGVHGNYLDINDTSAVPINFFQPLKDGHLFLGSFDKNGSSWVGCKVDAIFSPVLSFLNCKPSGLPDNIDKFKGDINIRCDNLNDISRDNLKNVSSFVEPEEAHCVSVRFDYEPHGKKNKYDRQSCIYNEYQNRKSNLSSPRSVYNHEKKIYFDNSMNSTAGPVEEDYEEEFNPYVFIKSLPKYSSVVSCVQSKTWLPPKDISDPSISLVLDLDETLVHCTVDPIPDANMIFPVFCHGIEYNVHVKTRPHLKYFLESVSNKFEVIVFTASQRVYANELLNRIDPDSKYIKHRMFRDSCLLVDGNYLKDLNVLGRDLATSVLVDNSPHAFGYQIDNGIPIESWFDDPHDTELLKLEKFLDTLLGVDDVREIVRSTFQTYQLIRDA